MDVWNYFEGKPEIFAALVAAIAVVGGVVGARIQANGGRDQAAAAREAAKIAAEAQRAAALWTVRQIQVAEFVQGVREVQRVLQMFYDQNSAVGGLEERLREAQQVVSQKRAEIELIVPYAVVSAASEVTESLTRYSRLTCVAGPAQYFTGVLQTQVFSPDPAQSALAHEAEDALSELHSLPASADPRPRARLFSAVVEAVRTATDATVEQAVSVAAYVSNDAFPSLLVDNSEELKERMSILVQAARLMLRSEEDLAPAVTPQRRRWWRAAYG